MGTERTYKTARRYIPEERVTKSENVIKSDYVIWTCANEEVGGLQHQRKGMQESALLDSSLQRSCTEF
jgi:hypothetical protein